MWPPTGSVRLSVLGDIALYDPAGNEIHVPKQRLQLLAILAASAGSVVDRETILVDIWGKDDATTRQRLKAQVAQLRPFLGEGLGIDFRHDGYRISGPVDQLDATLFESMVTSARGLPSEQAADRYATALRLWTGPGAFGGIDSLLVDGARWRLDQLRVQTTIELADCELDRRTPRASLALLQPMFNADPTRGDIARRLAALLACADRQRESLLIIDGHRAAMIAIGLSPAADLSDLERRIIRHEFVPSSGALDTAERAMEPLRHQPRPVDVIVPRLGLLGRILDRLKAGPLVLRGEAGAGKTTLAKLVGESLAEEGGTVITIRVRREPARTMEPIADIIAACLTTDPVGTRALLDAPDVHDAVARLSNEPHRTTQATSREYLLNSLASFVGSFLARPGATLIVEDGHWLDNGSAEVLNRAIASGCSHLLITGRQSVGTLFPDVGGTEVLDVPPLTSEEVRLLLNQALPVRSSPELADELHRRTGGNGLFLRVQVDLLADGQLGRELSPTVLHAVHERTAGLSRTAREVMQTAALLGQRFPLRPLAMLHPTYRTDLRDAVDERLVRFDEHSESGEFHHGLVVDALIEMITAVVRTSRHDQIWQALKETGAPPIALAQQALGAVSIDPGRAVSACAAAALQQAQVFDWPNAVAWSQRGIEAISSYSVVDAAAEACLHLVRGEALRKQHLPGGAADLARAAELALACGDLDLRARAVTELCMHGPTTQAGTIDTTARRLLEETLELDLSTSQRVGLLSAGATLLTMSEHAALGRTLYHEALREAEALGDTETLRATYLNAHLGLAHPDDLPLRRRATAWLSRQSDSEAQWESGFLRMGLALIDADRSELDRSLHTMRRLVSTVRQRNQRPALHQAETVHAFICGDLDRASALADQTFELELGSYPLSWAMGIYAGLIFPIREAQGRVAELGPTVAALIDSAPDFITWRALAACVAYASGDTDDLRATAAHLAACDVAFVEDLTFTALATIAARPIWAAGNVDGALQLYQRLLPYSGVMTWNGLSTHGPVDAGLACLADLLGDGTAVALHRQRALDLITRFDTPHLLWPELAQLSTSSPTSAAGIG